MEKISFIRIKKSIDDYVNKNSVETFYFNNIRDFICKKYSLPDDWDNFLKWVNDNFKALQNFSTSLTEQIKSDIAEKEKLEKESDSLINQKTLKQNLINETEIEFTKLPDLERQKRELISDIDKEIALIEPLADKDPYKQQFEKLRKEKTKAENWLKNVNKITIDLISKSDKLNQEKKILNSDIKAIQKSILEKNNDIEKGKKELNSYNFNQDAEINALKSIIAYLFKNNDSIEFYDEKLVDNPHASYYDQKWTETGLKLIKLKPNPKNKIPEINFARHHNPEFKSNWRTILKDYFANSPDFSQMHYVTYNKTFPNWEFEILQKIECHDMAAAIWLSIRQAIKAKPGLFTADGRIYLWITNTIYVELFFRKQKEQESFTGIFAKKEVNSDKTFEVKFENIQDRIIGGYTSSGFYIPYGVYIVTKDVSIEIHYKESALLQDNPSNLIIAQQAQSAASLNADNKSYEDSLDDD